MAMLMRRTGSLRNVARVLCSPPALVEAATPRFIAPVALRPIREASNATFEPGFHWRKMIQAHHMSCCAKQDNPPPREITVEYDEDCEYTDYFIEIADKVEAAMPEIAVLVSPTNTEARKGSFEITCDGHVIWSKLQKGRLPRFEDVLEGISQLPCEIEPQSASA